MLYSYGSFLSKITLSLLCIVAPVPYVSINPSKRKEVQVVLNYNQYMKVESHIQLPISVIESFSEKKPVVGENGKINKTDFVNVLGYGQNNISLVRTNEYGSQFGYYTEDIENLLSSEFETPIGEIRKKLIAFSKRKISEVSINNNDFLIIKRYLQMLLYRSQYFFNLYLKESKVASVVGTTHSEYIQMCYDLNIKPFENFDGYTIAVVVSNGERMFINSFTGFSFYQNRNISDKPMFFTPLSPTCGILFLLPKSLEKKDIYLDHLIANDDAVLDINKKIAITETIYSKNSLISKREKELLEVLQDFSVK